MTDIKKIAVLGSGVMGSGIAAHCANAGLEVTLLDIVPSGATNRNELAEKAVEKQLKAGGFTHAGNAKRITPGNLEDLQGIAGADWIIEAVLERLDVKQGVYRKVDAVRKKGSVVSSNTSTIPLHELTGALSDQFAHDFMIAHFFNPPRHMRLLEVVKGPKTGRETYAAVKQFADVTLGKLCVECKDTPGFIANRIGVFWMATGLAEALKSGITVEQADAAMARAGIPRTGIFGLYDLIGIDLMGLIAKELVALLPSGDPFNAVGEEPPLVKKMVEGGYTGRKGKGGFYRMSKQGEKKVKEVLDLSTGEYRAEAGVTLPSAKAKGISELVGMDDIGGRYAWAVFSRTLAYAASLIPTISDSVADVDAAMTTGYSWKDGPFAMIDAIGVEAFNTRLAADGVVVPPLLKPGKPLYTVSGTEQKALNISGAYAGIPKTPGHLWLADIKREAKPVTSNASAALWDIGEGVACLELTSKMGAVDANIMAFIEQALPRVQADFKGLVIGNDSERFSVGANLSVFMEHAKAGEWAAISDLIRRGQQAMLGLKYAPFPVVASLSGMALGGGCEIVLHARAVQAHMECQPGLVEVNVGLIPGWGGCKELRFRHNDGLAAFRLIIAAKTASSADDARDMKILREGCGVSMNRARLLADARARCLGLANGYTPPTPASAPAGSAQPMLAYLETLGEKASPHDKVIGAVLARVLSTGGDEKAVMAAEHEGFMELIRMPASQARIAHMLETGKPLKN